ncbi:MAG: WhiB family transcriptional regulator, partial [Acidimicrobiales bacterium]
RDPPTTLSELVGPRAAWMAQAACRGMGSETFFPERGEPLEPAKAICATCPVREPCLEVALGSMDGGAIPGIWGGTSARERRRMRKASA